MEVEFKSEKSANRFPRIILIILYLILTCPNRIAAQEFQRAEGLAGLDHVTTNNGVALADYDRDGDLDIFFVGFWGFDPDDETTWNRLLRNSGDGTFEDVTIEAGFDVQFVNTDLAATLGEKMAAAWGDYDNDGFPDLFLSNSREDQLYHNQGDGTFIDVTDVAGEAGCHECYTSGGLWWDHDRDGDLDLYVSDLKGPNRMFENNGDGTFDDVTEWFGLGGSGVTWASVVLDVGKDGFLDLYNANDTQENQFFENRSGIHYNEASRAYRVNDEGAGMGITVGDYNNDGFFDIYVTNIFNHHPNPLYKNTGNRRFEDVAVTMGVDNAGWGWGTKFFDYDHDGDEDLYVVTGVVSKQYIDGVEQVDEPNYFFKNLLIEGSEEFQNWSVESGANGEARGRGLETIDFDNDGDLDLLVANVGQPPYLYQNQTINGTQPASKNWVQIKLEGTISNRDAIGTEVKVTADGQSYYRWHHGTGFFCQSLAPVHVGLGAATIIDEIQVIWPNGRREIVYDVPVNQTLTLREGEQDVVTSLEEEIPVFSTNRLSGNYPNPFSNSTTFRFNFGQAGSLDIKIYSLAGQLVSSLEKHVANGTIEVSWNGTDLNGNQVPSGLYYYRADHNSQTMTGKLVKLN